MNFIAKMVVVLAKTGHVTLMMIAEMEVMKIYLSAGKQVIPMIDC